MAPTSSPTFQPLYLQIKALLVRGLDTSLARLEPCLAGHPVEWDWDAFAEAQAHYATLGFAPPVAAS